MSTVAIAMVLKPLGFLLLLLICAPFVYAVRRWMPEGRLKRILLFKLS